MAAAIGAVRQAHATLAAMGTKSTPPAFPMSRTPHSPAAPLFFLMTRDECGIRRKADRIPTEGGQSDDCGHLLIAG